MRLETLPVSMMGELTSEEDDEGVDVSLPAGMVYYDPVSPVSTQRSPFQPSCPPMDPIGP